MSIAEGIFVDLHCDLCYPSEHLGFCMMQTQALQVVPPLRLIYVPIPASYRIPRHIFSPVLLLSLLISASSIPRSVVVSREGHLPSLVPSVTHIPGWSVRGALKG